MRKNIVWIAAFVALVLIGDRIGGYFLNNIAKSSQFRYSRMYKGGADAEILLVGNSRGLIFYQPYIEEITNKKTFNISYNGMPINLAHSLIKDYYERHVAPKLLILDVTMCDRWNNELLAGFNMYSPFSTNLDKLITDSLPKVAWGGKVSHLTRYNSEVFQRALYYMNKSDEDWLLDRVISEKMVEDINKQKNLHISFTDNMLQDLVKIIQIAKEKGTVVKLVVNPYYPPFADKIENLAEIKAKIEAKTGLQVADYSKSITELDGFGDYQHLNKKGSMQYLDILAKDKILDSTLLGLR